MLFNDTIFGPVHSRRLGASLGINLLPTNAKYCNYNCIYCECGWNKSLERISLPTRMEVNQALIARLEELRIMGRPLDAITFAGNGEPTLHVDFPSIVADTLSARDQHFPAAQVVVLSNGSRLHMSAVREALLSVDEAALKLDSALDATVRLLNGVQHPRRVAQTVELFRGMNHRFTLQTMFVRGTYRRQRVDNTTREELEAWLAVVSDLLPREVMVYTIDRATPAKQLEKVPLPELEAIARRVEALGCRVSVAG